MKKFLIIDDSPEDRAILHSWLQETDHEFEVIEAATVVEGLRLFKSQDIHCVLLDYNFPTESALDFLEGINAANGIRTKAPIVVVTGQGNDTVAVNCLKAGAVDYINKDRLNDPGHVAAKIVNRVLNEHDQLLEIERSRAAERAAIVSLTEKKRELEQIIDQLRLAKLAADSANTAKSAFLANMSHEIRSPLTSIIGFVQLLREGNLTPGEISDYQVKIENNGQHLLTVINEILDFSKVEAGSINLRVVDCDIRSILTELVETFRKPARAKDVQLRLFIHPDFPSLIETDATRIRQIITNLLSNALKFTHSGDISIVGRLEASFSNGVKNQFTILVSDTGVGINKVDAEKLFKRFTQANEGISPKFGGTGLGLVLSRELAQAMGGELNLISSEPGFGSLFKLTLPLLNSSNSISHQSLSSKPVEILDTSPLIGRNVVVVDDSIDNQALLSKMLSSRGINVHCLPDGLIAVRELPRLDPDLVIMDVQMPNLDGFQATKKLRELGFAKPIIALTAHALMDEQSKFGEAGFSAQLTKPIDRNQLLRELLRFST